jgi:hypothetical protein
MPASLELVKIALQAYGSGDCEIALALAGPHVRWDERASRPDGDLVWGHDKVQRAMRRYLDSWQEYRFDLEDIAEVGPGKVVGICRERGKPKDGPEVDRRSGGYGGGAGRGRIRRASAQEGADEERGAEAGGAGAGAAAQARLPADRLGLGLRADRLARELRGLGRALADADALSLERLLLRLSGP